MALGSEDNIVDRALEVLKPEPDREGACRATIETDLQLLKKIVQDPDPVSSGKLKELLTAVVQALSDVERKIKALPSNFRSKIFSGLGHTAPIDPKAYIAETQATKQAAALLCDHLLVGAGSPPRNPVKQLTALFAQNLLREYSSKPRTLTPSGPYLTLASILYEGVTGEQEADLKRTADIQTGLIETDDPTSHSN
jgi:hypothetical protein